MSSTAVTHVDKLLGMLGHRPGTSVDAVEDVTEQLVLELFDIGAVKFGEFTLKSGIKSPVYIDLRLTVSFPKLMRAISERMFSLIADLDMDVLCGVPYTALPLATCMSLDHGVSMCMARKEPKAYGTKKCIEGVFRKGDVCVIVEDLITSGTSIIETVNKLKAAGLRVAHAVVLVDRQQGGIDNLKSFGEGIECRAVLTIESMLATLVKHRRVTDDSLIASVRAFLDAHRKVEAPALRKTEIASVKPKAAERKAAFKRLSFEKRAELSTNPIGKALFQLMARKKTSLCLSADVTTCDELLTLAESVGPQICLLKTHMDIVSDFAEKPDFIEALKGIAKKHDFLIFEDRKFADIGNTVMRQFDSGVYKISQWADIVNCHTVPGKGVIEGLKRASIATDGACGKCPRHGLLILAEMSSAGNLASLTGYTQRSVEWALEYKDFVLGFISMRALCPSEPTMICMTPGVNLKSKGDGIGQQYNTPDKVIGENGSDIIIVGRGIYKSENPVESAKVYRNAAWRAYQSALTES